VARAHGVAVRGWGLVPGVLVAISILMSCTTVQNREAEHPLPAVFRLKAPGATRVSVAGTFNGWDPQADPLRGPDRNGVWSLVLPLRPGRYRYLFVVDGVRWVTDPNAPASEADGFGGRNSLLFHGH